MIATMTSLPGLPRAAGYALRILVCLALSPGRRVPAPAVGRCAGIPSAQASKVLHYLSLRGLTCARRGSKGGYLLRDSAEQISVEQVIQLFRPQPDSEVDASSDPLLQVWLETAGQCQQAWEQMTIAELARRTVNQWRCAACTGEQVVVGDFGRDGQREKETKINGTQNSG